MKRRRNEPPLKMRAIVRVFGVFFALLTSASYISTISHMAFVAHAICAEHGGFVHVEAAKAAPVALPQRDAPPVSVDNASPTFAEEHDHCTLGIAEVTPGRIARLAVITLPEVNENAVPIISVIAAKPIAELPPPPISILLLSPKSSPPA